MMMMVMMVITVMMMIFLMKNHFCWGPRARALGLGAQEGPGPLAIKQHPAYFLHFLWIGWPC